ncbi:hypothetical protein EMN47_07710 [Prolixibacteraceae bacterium JC049]|nr:hypothetical protein [Prolixibacteraceae bacterium JC049]
MIARWQILILVLLCQFGWAQQTPDFLQRNISLKVDTLSLPSVLDSIGKQGGFYFSYSSKLVDAEAKVTMNAQRQAVQQVLERLFPDNVRFKSKAKQVILYCVEDSIKEKIAPEMIQLEGKVIDRRNGKPIPYVNIVIKNHLKGTITNVDGNYLFKIEPIHANDTIIYSCLGYERLEYPVSELANANKTIFLQTSMVQIPEIKVTYVDPEDVIRKCIDRIDSNYNNESVLLHSFFREMILVDHRYTGLSEAIIEILKRPVRTSINADALKVVKGRQSPFVKPHKYVNFKLMGSPYYMNQIDLVKNPQTFLQKETMPYYKYTFEEMVMHNDRPAYVIKFTPFDAAFYPLFKGKMYIDSYSYALVYATFEMNRYSMRQMKNSFIRKETRNVRARPVGISYTVSYVPMKGKWFLNTVKGDLKFRVRSRNKLFSSLFNAQTELLVTKRDFSVTHPFHRREAFRSRHILTEVLLEKDKGFWHSHNIIEPHSDLNEALDKFQKSIKKSPTEKAMFQPFILHRLEN